MTQDTAENQTRPVEVGYVHSYAGWCGKILCAGEGPTPMGSVSSIKASDVTCPRCKAMIEETHCKDCCCARAWKALGVTSYTGLSIPEHILALRTQLEAVLKKQRDECND